MTRCPLVTIGVFVVSAVFCSELLRLSRLGAGVLIAWMGLTLMESALIATDQVYLPEILRN